MTYEALSFDELTRQGLAHFQSNRPLEAKSFFERAIAMSPDTPSAHSNLGNVLGTLGEFDAALTAFYRAIELQPSYKTAYLNLALTQQEHGQSAAAVDNFLMVIALDPASFQAHYMLGVAYFELKQNHLALDAVDKALALQPISMEALHNKSSILTMLGKINEAIDVYKHILALDPASESARYHLAKYGHADAESDAPTTAPASYVTDLFDQYAATFDEQLVGTLGYQAPTQIGKLFRGLGHHAANLRALDLGCGTGLVAEQLQDLQMQWTGIDLSQKMIAAAAKKSLYAQLHCASIENYLARAPANFDLITSADVFIYVGELTSTFKLVSEHLTDNGWFVFSVEKSDQQPLVLRPSGRFAHSEAYLSGLAAQFGLAVQTVSPLTLRFDGNAPIDGLVVALQKLS